MGNNKTPAPKRAFSLEDIDAGKLDGRTQRRLSAAALRGCACDWSEHTQSRSPYSGRRDHNRAGVSPSIDSHQGVEALYRRGRIRQETGSINRLPMTKEIVVKQALVHG